MYSAKPGGACRHVSQPSSIAALDTGVDSMITEISTQLSTGATTVSGASWGDAAATN